MMVIAQATTYERLPIQTMHMKNVSGKLFFHFGFSQSGIVSERVKWMGHETIHLSFTQLLLVLGNSLRYSNSKEIKFHNFSFEHFSFKSAFYTKSKMFYSASLVYFIL
jgi:hypothetical protein